jgi:polysaccharide chain length determinant protein (PEP-CTERM system associated)
MLPGKSLTTADVISALTRHRWLILFPLAIGLAIVPAIARYLPETFRSETLILVIPQRVPDSYVKSTVTASVADRLPSISDEILSRSRLERVINDFGLYPGLRASAPMEDVVSRMRRDIGSPQIRPGEQSFRISYVSEDPQVAQKVAGRLASLFIEENSLDRENRADSTNSFLESQLQEAERQLAERERKLEDYKRRHSGELPTQLESNLQQMQNARTQLQSLSDSLNRARERKLLFERQIADARMFPQGITPAPTVVAGQETTTILSTAQQLDIARTRLEAMRLRYKPDYPEVRSLERTIRELEAKAAAEAQRPPEQAPPKALSASELAQQKHIRDLQAELEVIDHQLTLGQADESRLRELIADYQRKVDAVPTRESELVQLTRDYEILKKNYDDLLSKREGSRLAANLERRQIGEQFRILDPASLPERPDQEVRRLAIVFSPALACLALGLAIVALLEFRDSSFKRDSEIEQILNVPVLATVPAMSSASERRQRRVRSVIGDLAVGAALLGSAAAAVIFGVLKA